MSIDKTLKQQISTTPRAAGEQPFSALPDLAVPDDGTIVPAVDSGINYTFSLAALKKFVKSQMSKTVFFDASIADSYTFSIDDLEQHEKIRVVMTALPVDDRELTLFFPIAWDSSQGIKVEVDYSGLDSTFVNTLVLRWGIGTLIYQRFFFLMPSAYKLSDIVPFMGQRFRFEILRGIIRHPYGAICLIEGVYVVGEVPDSGGEDITYKYTFCAEGGSSYIPYNATGQYYQITLGGDYAFAGSSDITTAAFAPFLEFAVNFKLKKIFRLISNENNGSYYSYQTAEDWVGTSRVFGVGGSVLRNIIIFAVGEQ